MADRYAYIPLIGLFVIIAWGVSDLIKQWRYRKLVLGLSMPIILLALAICTHFQVRHWRNSITLFEHALRVTRNNFVAHFCIANPLRQADQVDKAIYHLNEALRIRPGWLDAHNSLGITLSESGKANEAIAQFTYILELDPNHVMAHSNLGSVLAKQNRFNEAVTHFNRALSIKPDSDGAHGQLAMALAGQGKFEEAIKHYNEALRLNPYWADVINNLAWIFATHKEARFSNPGEAIRLAERACELTDYESPGLLDTLAAAYAAMGKFPEAIEIAGKAIRLAEAENKKDMAADIRNRLNLYQANQPYMEQ